MTILEPNLIGKKITDESRLGESIQSPFDPNDLSCYKKHSEVKRLYEQVKKNLPDGIRIKKLNGIEYFQTRKDYKCKCNDL